MLGYFAYNFIKIYRTLRVTPATAAGVTSRLWEVSDLVALLEETGSVLRTFRTLPRNGVEKSSVNSEGRNQLYAA